jgi:inorganic pyrophosphatase
MNTTSYLGQKVNVVIDRPLGSKHPKRGFVYKVNYGYIPNTKSPDGEELDAYVLGVDKQSLPQGGKTTGICIAVIHRIDDNDDKLVITPNGEDFSDKEIEKLVEFQEKWFKHVILRKKI